MTTEQMQDAWELPVASGQPMQDIEGDLTSAKLKPSPNAGGNPMLLLGLTKIKVHKSLTAWPHDQYSIEVPYAMKNARWIALTDSLQEFIGPGKAFGEAKGMRIRFAWVSDIKGRIPSPDMPGDWVDGMLEGWRVVGVGGDEVVKGAVAGNVPAEPDEPIDFDAKLIELANGETEGGFVQSAIKDITIKGNPELLEQVFAQNAGILAGFIEDGRLIKDGDIFKLPEIETAETESVPAE